MQDPSKFNIELSTERISRGVYGISGNFLLNVDIVENDGNTVFMISEFDKQLL